MKKRKPRTPKKSFDQVAKKSTVDNKLTLLNLHLECIFDRGVNFNERIIVLTDEIAFPMFDIVDAALTQMESESKKTVTIRIHSLGGDPYEAMAIIGRMKKSKCHIVTEGYGTVMSAATLIFAAGNKRKISEYAWFMWHESSMDPGFDRASGIEDALNQLKREELLWAKYMGQFSTTPEDFWMTEGVRKNAYFTAEELVHLGVADEIF